ncbi:MAG TPA: hypothetical protein VGZ02_10880 [Candidatus Baltobacteraceae bacterium]|jgi:hypothetical protein|nr:hypothetical protein [Candidatus Baltobacteraceae bacterium]
MPFLRAALLLTLILVAGIFCGAGVRAQEATPEPSPAATETPVPLPSPVPVAEDPKVHKLAVQQFLAWQQGQIDRALYSNDVNGQLSDDVISEAAKTLANMGALQSATFKGISHAKQGDLYVYHMTCDRGSVDMDFSLDPSGKILRIYFN